MHDEVSVPLVATKGSAVLTLFLRFLVLFFQRFFCLHDLILQM